MMSLFSYRHRLFYCLLLCLLPSIALAQGRSSVIERIESLERQLGAINTHAVQSGTARGAASLDVRLVALEEELRRLSGRLEEIEHNQRRVTERFDALERDMDARMQALEARTPAAAPPVIGEEPAASATPDPYAPPVKETKPVAAEEAVSSAPAFDSPREHYDAAFRALNQSDYASANNLFASFLTAYPKDALAGNAYYWLGETYYVQRQYAPAAEQFRSGFEAQPDGPKAPDNLLKLGMSLSLLNRNQEACVVLKQLLKKYGEQSAVVARKATMESARLKCQ